MKIVIPLDENKTDVCVTFGRAPFFLVGNETATEILTNPGAEAQGGAGIKAAQFVVDQEADALVTVRCGQNSADVFAAAEIQIFKASGTSAQENLEACLAGKLDKLTHFHAGYQGIR